VPEGECGELCQLLGFSDWDTFSSWWNSLPDGWRPLLQGASFGDILSFDFFGDRLNLAFVKMGYGNPQIHLQGNLDNVKLAFWDCDFGVSIDLLHGLMLWAGRSGDFGYTRLNDSGHPWNGQSLIEGRSQYVSFDETWGYAWQLLIRAKGSAALVSLGIVMGKADAPGWVTRLLNGTSWAADAFGGMDLADVVKELTVDADSWVQMGTPVVHNGNFVDHLKNNPWLWQREYGFGQRY